MEWQLERNKKKNEEERQKPEYEENGTYWLWHLQSHLLGKEN